MACREGKQQQEANNNRRDFWMSKNMHETERHYQQITAELEAKRPGCAVKIAVGKVRKHARHEVNRHGISHRQDGQDFPGADFMQIPGRSAAERGDN